MPARTTATASLVAAALTLALAGVASGQTETGATDDSWADDSWASDDWADDDWADEPESAGLPFTVGGFIEAAGGVHLRDNPAVQAQTGNDYNLAETRLRLDLDGRAGGLAYTLRGDLLGDAVTDEVDAELREALLSFTLGERTDVRVGRQILTWGTGDLLFINDVFPKDWESFLIGRDEDYLKAPSDALRTTWYGDSLTLDLVATADFQPDRYVDGERLSYFGGPAGQTAEPISPLVDEPDDGELALRLATRQDSTEYALYGYHGYSPQPDDRRGQFQGRLTHPELNVIGASLRRSVGPGIGNAEIGWYDSVDNRDGDQPLMPHSALKALVGYDWEAVTNVNIGLQAYLEWTRDHDRKIANLEAIEAATGVNGLVETAGEEWRQLLTTRVTWTRMRGDLTWSLFAFVSPSDDDLYLRPTVRYRLSDQLTLSAGGNLFAGSDDTSFFGQFERDSTVYARARFRF